MKLVWLAVPLLVVLTLLELAAARRAGHRWHGLRDSIGNAGCGAVEQAVGALIYPLLFFAYRWLEANAALVTLPTDHVATWIYAFVLGDLAFYLFHRCAHQVPVIWATHAVHHASPHMNYTVAMRNGALQRLFAVWFYLPLAVLGVPGDVLLVMLSVQIIYQFVLHTRFGGDFGVLGWVFATPSHHRVHHGQDAAYLDHNYGAVLIIWDRLFGTFAAETVEPTYGITDPALRTDNPLWANAAGWVALFRRLRAVRADRRPGSPDRETPPA